MGNVQVPCLITRGFFYLCHEELSLVLRANACDPTPSKTPVHLKNLQKWKAPKNPLRSQLCQTNMKWISPKYIYIYIYMYIYMDIYCFWYLSLIDPSLKWVKWAGWTAPCGALPAIGTGQIFGYGSQRGTHGLANRLFFKRKINDLRK